MESQAMYDISVLSTRFVLPLSDLSDFVPDGFGNS